MYNDTKRESGLRSSGMWHWSAAWLVPAISRELSYLQRSRVEWRKFRRRGTKACVLKFSTGFQWSATLRCHYWSWREYILGIGMCGLESVWTLYRGENFAPLPMLVAQLVALFRSFVIETVVYSDGGEHIVVITATRSDWTVRGSNLGRDLPCCSDLPQSPTNLLYNGYWVFPGDNVAGTWCWSPNS